MPHLIWQKHERLEKVDARSHWLRVQASCLTVSLQCDVFEVQRLVANIRGRPCKDFLVRIEARPITVLRIGGQFLGTIFRGDFASFTNVYSSFLNRFLRPGPKWLPGIGSTFSGCFDIFLDRIIILIVGLLVVRTIL